MPQLLHLWIARNSMLPAKWKTALAQQYIIIMNPIAKEIGLKQAQKFPALVMEILTAIVQALNYLAIIAKKT